MRNGVLKMKRSSNRRNSKVRYVAAVVTFVLLLPLMLSALITSAPSYETAVFHAADASARLASGNVFSLSKTATQYQDEEIADNSEDEETGDIYYAYLSFDDSNMISHGSLNIPSGANEELR